MTESGDFGVIIRKGWYHPPRCTPWSRHTPGMFDRMTVEPFENLVFNSGHYHDIIQWVAENTDGRWTLDGSWGGFWVIRFENAADAIKMRMVASTAVERPALDKR